VCANQAEGRRWREHSPWDRLSWLYSAVGAVRRLGAEGSVPWRVRYALPDYPEVGEARWGRGVDRWGRGWACGVSNWVWLVDRRLGFPL
jgi:hypothetical protein